MGRLKLRLKDPQNDTVPSFYSAIRAILRLTQPKNYIKWNYV